MSSLPLILDGSSRYSDVLSPFDHNHYSDGVMYNTLYRGPIYRLVVTYEVVVSITLTFRSIDNYSQSNVITLDMSAQGFDPVSI